MTKSNNIFFIFLFTFFLCSALLSSLLIKVAPFVFHHTVYYCKEALANTSISLPDSAPILFSGVLLLIFLSGIVIFSVQFLKTSLYLRRVLSEKLPLSRNVSKIAKQLNIAGKVDLVESKSVTIFCYGLFRPRICMSTSLVQTLTNKELTAVLAHEKCHLQNRDPLKILLSQVITSMLFFVPSLKDINNFFTLSKELAADKAAIDSLGDGKYLKNALGKMLNPLSLNLVSVAAFAQAATLEARILSIGGYTPTMRISFKRLVLSLLMVVITLVVLKTPVYSIGDDSKHTYVLNPYGNQCRSAYIKETVTHDLFSSSIKNYSENP